MSDDAAPLMIKRLADECRPTKIGVRVSAMSGDMPAESSLDRADHRLGEENGRETPTR